jgi:hypothetical protein
MFKMNDLMVKKAQIKEQVEQPIFGITKSIPNFWILVFASILFAMHFLMIECSSNVIDLFICVIYDVQYV